MKAPDKLKKVWAFEKDPGKGSISSLWSVLLLVICVSLYCLSVLKFKSLPAARPVTYEEGFSGVRAKNYLKILSDIGPRIAGSRANEVEATSLLVAWLNSLRDVAQQNGRELDVDVQIADGSSKINFNSNNYLSAVYYGLKNVVARLRPAGQVPENALLVNAHFDTVPRSEGGGDDGSMCAVMLETLSQLALSPAPPDPLLEHSVIFLFNGFEEEALQGSHAFITKHSWAPSVRAVINLEAAGNGGREIVFQAGPRHPWLMSHYGRTAKRPYASAMVEEMFQSGLVPSDTDFRIFRDYGRIPGMDLAYTENGYVYHTEFDTEERFPAESLQHAGDNVLPLIKSLMTSEELRDTQSHEAGHMIFYDFFNVALISYSESTGAIINAVLATIGVLLLALSCFFFVRQGQLSVLVFARELGFTMIIQTLSLVVGAGLVLLAAVLYHAAGRSMSWFTSTYLIFFIYFCPFYLGLAMGPAFFVGFRRGNPLTIPQNAQLFLHVQQLFYIVLLSALTGMEIRSCFLIMIPVFFYNISLLFNVALKLQARPHAWMFVHLVCQIIPFMWFATTTASHFITSIPMEGRSGSAGNPEFQVAAFSIIFATLLGGFLVPLVTVCRSPRITSLMFAALWLVGIILMATPLGFAFREGEAPQRFSVFHMNRQFHSLSGDLQQSDSGFFVSYADAQGASVIEDVFGSVPAAQDMSRSCHNDTICLPIPAASNWYPAQRAVIPDTEVALSLTQQDMLEGGTVILHFELQGPERMSMLIYPETGSRLSDWSFEESVPDYPNQSGDGLVYSITYSNFKLGVPNPRDSTEFWLRIENATTSGKILEISVTGQYMWHQEEKSREFQEILSKFPPWATVNSWIRSYDHYEF